MHSESAEDFIRMAEEDYNALQDLKYFDFRSTNAACYHAQQYAEKMIKAKLIMMGKRPLHTHNLILLLEDFDDSEELELAREYAGLLTDYEVHTRYPRSGITIYSQEDAEEAYDMALRIPYLIGLYKSSIPKDNRNKKPRSIFSRLKR